MTLVENNILILPATNLKNATPKTIESLTEISNLGFSPAHRHKLVSGNRINGSENFFVDFGFTKNIEKCLLYFYTKEDPLLDPKLKKFITRIDIPNSSQETNFFILDSSKPLDYVFPLDFAKSTVGFKPYKGENVFEMTDYASFEKCCAAKLFWECLPHLRQVLHCKTVIAQCFVPHHLVEHYESVLDFKEIERVHFTKDECNSNTSVFPKGLYFHGDFDYSTLTKDI